MQNKSLIVLLFILSSLLFFSLKCNNYLDKYQDTYSNSDSDITPVAELLNTPPNITNTAEINVTVAGNGVVSYRYNLDSGGWSDETDAAFPIAESGLSDGSHALDVIGADYEGNWQSEGSATGCAWTVDTLGPVAVLSNTPSSVTNITDISITVSGDDIACYRYNLDGQGWSDVVDVHSPIADSGLADSAHTLRVTGCDLAGNWQSEDNATEYTWNIFYIYNIGTVGQMGSETAFNSGNTGNISSAALDSTHIAIAYRDAGDSNYGKAAIASVFGNNIIFGNEYTFNNAYTNNIYITKLDSTHIAITYCDHGDSRYGKAIIGTISGNAVTFGSETTFNNAVTLLSSVATLNSTHIAIAFRDNADDLCYGKVVIGTVSGNSVTFGNEYTFNNANTYFIYLDVLDSAHIAIAYRDTGDSYRDKIIIGTISGSTVTFGSSYTFNIGYNGFALKIFSIAVLDSTHIAVAFCDNTDSYSGKAVIGTISGNTVTYGNEYTFNNASTTEISAVVLDPTHVTIAYHDSGDSNYGKVIIGEISGNTVTYGNEYTFNNAATTEISVAVLDSANMITLYYSSDGKARTIFLKSIEGTDTIWDTAWPADMYEIKFGTAALDGVGSPDTWFIINSVVSPNFLLLNDCVLPNELLPNGTTYIIRKPH